MKRIAALATCLVAAAGAFLVVSCGTAPVKPAAPPEAPKASGKKCLECHPEFTSRFAQGNVHAPVKEGDCFACHRPHGIYGKILFRADQPMLCYSCHQQVRPKDTAKSVHKPLTTGPCSTCHNPHNSDFPALLAAQGKESCFSCHDRAEFAQQFGHPPLDKGCDSCHDSHSSDNVSLLRQAPDANCKSCHDAGQPGFVQAHFKYPVQTGCILCHSPHSASVKNLLKKVVHAPVGKGQCDSCHTVANGGIQTKQAADQLCLQCHDITKTAMSVHQPYTQGKCTTCHDVHASNYTAMLADAPERICLTCHSAVAADQEAAPTKEGAQPAAQAAGESARSEEGTSGAPAGHVRSVSQHKPVTEGKCLACHKGHAAEQKAMLKADPGKLCFDCHDQQGYTTGKGSHPADDAQKCATCHLPHKSGVRSLLKGEKERDLCFSCHKTTAVERGRFSLHKPFAQGNCGECHLLHKSRVPGFLVEQYTDGKLCANCHTGAQKVAENLIAHAPVTQGQCSRCHSPHAADFDKVLRRPESELCFGCHQGVKQAHEGAAVKHKPLVEGKCTDCHTAHGSPYKNILKQNQPKLCLTCHVAVAEFWVKGAYHEPAAKDCLQCHKSHGSDNPAILAKPSSELCTQCHDTKTDGFSKAHYQMTPSPESCVSCHSPHGSPVKSMLYPVVHKPFEERSCSPCHSGR